MSFAEIEYEALALSENQRAGLVCKLLDTLPPASADVSDEEVAARERALENGAVQPLSHEEFVRRVKANR